MNKIIGSLFLFLSVLYAAPFQQAGFIESKMSISLDTLQDGGSSFIHQERINWGFEGTQDFVNLDYRINIGGVLRGNTAFSMTQFTPEYGFRANAQPHRTMDLALFSYSRLRNPMQILSDSLQYKEFVHGLKLGTQISATTRLSVATGLKSQDITHRDTISSSQQFIQLGLDQRIAGMQIRFSGETDMWERDGMGSRQNTLLALQWYGSPAAALRWNASNSLYLTDDYSFWRISHRMNYDLSQRQKIWVNYNQGDFAYGAQSLIRQTYDLRYRFQWKPAMGIDLAVKGNRVSVADSIDIFHWRSYGVSTFWNKGRSGFARGNLDVGFKESFLYGKGLDLLVNSSESKQVYRSNALAVQLRDDLSAEYFQRMDETDDPRYDIRHKFRITTEFLPENKFRIGNHIKVHNHFGSDLDFSPDTLRNAVIDELYVKSFSQRSQFSVFYRTVFELVEPDNDLQFNLNTRYFRQLSRTLSCNFMSLYRFQSEKYPDYLWLSAALRYNTSLFSYAIELQSGGAPDMAFKQDSQIWMRFVRQI
ncbi:MAG: hypothetical protein K9N35_10480 [Candidatus Marinimicrobia bacterium]|nr:hypothetical protein [Candidatus Neomarinimicrobiota bacterium]